jgi:hypothetical protein
MLSSSERPSIPDHLKVHLPRFFSLSNQNTYFIVVVGIKIAGV